MRYLSLKHVFAVIIFIIIYPYHAHTQHTILVFGDSLSAGYGLESNEDWPTLLNNKLQQDGFAHYQIKNLSLSGETTHGGVLRLPKALSRYRPKVIVIALGANDGLRGQSLKTMQNNLIKMVNLASNTKTTVILAGMRIPPNYGKRYARQFHQSFITVAEKTKVVLLPFLLKGIAKDDSLFQKDRLHPTADAQPIITHLVYEYLKPLLHSKE